jgi:2-polyprenyl-3-methyl-5-hydroxy-6-metoxy-1,4-benzoquinol methylase
MARTAVVVVHGNGLKGIEGETAQRVSRRLLSEGGDMPPSIFGMDRDDLWDMRDLLKKDYEVFVFISGTLFITGEGIETLSRIVSERREFTVIGPVSNESRKGHQRHAPPFFYQTIPVFRWAAGQILSEFKDEVAEADELDDFCFAMRKESLDALPGDGRVTDVPGIIKESGQRSGVARGVYAHRYGSCYESGRDDLLKHVPPGAERVLDVGAAQGLFGELLKRRQKCFVTGVDTDSELLSVAGKRLDSVIEGDIEEVIDRGILETYDCIVCGDVLEHLNNPWKVVKGLKKHLGKGGLFVASTPNIMNWAIIFDQLRGRWDYVPFSILSGTHIRFFTKGTLKDLFEGAGYTIKEMLLQSFEIPPRGAEFIEGLKNISPRIKVEELKASEIVVVAAG